MHKVETAINEVSDGVYNKWIDDICVANLEQRQDTRSYGHSVIDAAVEPELMIVIYKQLITQYCNDNGIDEAKLRISVVAEKPPSRVKLALVKLVETRALTSIRTYQVCSNSWPMLRIHSKVNTCQIREGNFTFHLTQETAAKFNNTEKLIA